MYTSMALGLVLAVQPAADAAPKWMTDYGQAKSLAKKEGRPLAVFVGTGEAGYTAVSRDGMLSARARELLAKNYVPVYLNIAQPAGRRLADTFEITNRGLILSDRTCQLQAFHINGELSEADLVRQLDRFKNGAAVRTTESNGNSRISYYQPYDGGSAAPAYAPTIRYGGGRSC